MAFWGEGGFQCKRKNGRFDDNWMTGGFVEKRLTHHSLGAVNFDCWIWNRSILGIGIGIGDLDHWIIGGCGG